MKLLMENWRRFLNEDKAEDLSRLLETMGLYMEQTNFGYNIALMEIPRNSSGKINTFENPQVIGMIETVESSDKKPCIPKTHQIGSVASHPSVAKTGVGTYLYEVAAFLVHENFDGGITSDHYSSTTNPAKDVWDRLLGKFNYIKRKTPKGPDKETYNPETGEAIPAFKGGNDKFDYHGWKDSKPPEEQHPEATPDPLDDCEEVGDYAKAAMDHSLEIPPARIAFVGKMMTKQIQNYHDYKQLIGDEKEGQQMDGYIMRLANKLFNIQYQPAKTGVYGDDKK
jgi:hypothetical protein